jgi:hypothetical protein
MRVLHRYALRFERKDWVIDIGFEQALEPGVDRLIHEKSIELWRSALGQRPVTADEKAELLSLVKEYCEAKRIRYRVVN